MNKRQAAERRGRIAEWQAAMWLRLKGYTVLAQRVKTRVGEVDLIAEKEGVLCFVEVKARPSVDAALYAVTPAASRRIQSAAASWAAKRPDLGANGWRYDIIAVVPWRLPFHARDAWRPEW